MEITVQVPKEAYKVLARLALQADIPVEQLARMVLWNQVEHPAMLPELVRRAKGEYVSLQERGNHD